MASDDVRPSGADETRLRRGGRRHQQHPRTDRDTRTGAVAWTKPPSTRPRDRRHRSRPGAGRMTNRHGFAGAIALLGVCATLNGCAAASPSEAQTVVGGRAREAEWFVKTGCTECHSVTVYGVLNLAATAPDLSIAVEDVPKRFGRSLDDFFQAPTGTMSMVLSSRIPLTDEERAVAVGKLKEAYRRHQERAGANTPVSSH